MFYVAVERRGVSLLYKRASFDIFVKIRSMRVCLPVLVFEEGYGSPSLLFFS